MTAVSPLRPVGAKQPKDHQPAKPAVKNVDGGKQVTLHGVTVTVADAATDDFELLDDIYELDMNGNAARFPSLLHRLVGDDYKAVMGALRDPSTGRVSIQIAVEFVRDLMGALNPNS